MRPTALTPLRKYRAALWAVLLSFAYFQVAAAEHAAEHAFEEGCESCTICLKFSDAKTSFADAGAEPVLACPAVTLDTTTEVADGAASVRRTAIRAPPLA
ncbi:MAG: hypothetical protein QNI99_21145 [Woeseiaceae bacterium]|nr:hypothetical protein [Woeseiaceae bacterium]